MTTPVEVAFPNFPKLPWEARNLVWLSLLPDMSDPNVTSRVNRLIRALAAHSLHPPGAKIHKGWRIRKITHDPIFIQDEFASPYADLMACHESQLVALKHTRSLLLQDTKLRKWINGQNHGFQPQFVLRNGVLLYICIGITSDQGIDVGQFCFWEDVNSSSVTMDSDHPQRRNPHEESLFTFKAQS